VIPHHKCYRNSLSCTCCYCTSG